MFFSCNFQKNTLYDIFIMRECSHNTEERRKLNETFQKSHCDNSMYSNYHWRIYVDGIR